MLNPTPTRLALMRAIERGEVEYRNQFGGPPRVRCGHRTVTVAYLTLRDAELVTLGRPDGPSYISGRPVELTDAGREWLATNDEHRDTKEHQA